MMTSGDNISEEQSIRVEDRLCVAVGKDVNESKSILLWALRNSDGRKIWILHVHKPAQWIPLMGTQFPASQLGEHQVREHQEIERQAINKLLHNYSLICEKEGVQADTMYTEENSIEKGIVELIFKNGIRKLVMGAAADKHYSKKMMAPKSKKAIYVCKQAPSNCLIWFICKSNLVHTRDGRLDGVGMEVYSPIPQASPKSEPVLSSSLRSQAVDDQLRLKYSAPGYRRARSEILKVENVYFSPSSSGGKLSIDGILTDWNESSKESPRNSTCSISSSSADGSPLFELDIRNSHHTKEDHHQHSSPPSVLQERDVNDELYNRLDQAMAEAIVSKREAFEESTERRKAENNVLDVIQRSKILENLYFEELRLRKETEEAVARGNGEIEKLKLELDEIVEQLDEAQEQKACLDRQITNSEEKIQDLERKMFSAVELLQKYKKERDELEVELDDALKMAEDLRRKQADEASSTTMPHVFSEYSFSDIEAATNLLDQSLKIGEGKYGSVFKGILRHTQVAIKIRHSQSSQGLSDFWQEVTILSKLRHPNIVTLIGACPEACSLIYEYLPNGSLEDRLICRDNTPPLSWKTRLRIAAELCSLLMFLHSCSSHGIIHGNLNPSDILLDADYVSKLSDFGICCALTETKFSSGNTSWVTNHPKGTFYMDPEFLATGELTPKSDVYSFGIILLRLLTGKSAVGLTKEVQFAIDNGNLKDLLDPTAGDWPFVQAKQLAHLAIRCCETNREARPDLTSEISRVLEPLMFSCGTSSFQMSSDEHRFIPHYFICPIFQEIMQDPHVAADGFTYELEAIRGWLDGGNDTSPMTNLQLPHHNLVPNHALRSAIQEWQQLNIKGPV